MQRLKKEKQQTQGSTATVSVSANFCQKNATFPEHILTPSSSKHNYRLQQSAACSILEPSLEEVNARLVCLFDTLLPCGLESGQPLDIRQPQKISKNQRMRCVLEPFGPSSNPSETVIIGLPANHSYHFKVSKIKRSNVFKHSGIGIQQDIKGLIPMQAAIYQILQV